MHIRIAYRLALYIECECLSSPVYYSHVIAVIAFMASTVIDFLTGVLQSCHCSHCFYSHCIYTLHTDSALHVVVASYHRCITAMSLQSLHSWLLQPLHIVIVFPHWCITVMSLQSLLLQSLHTDIACYIFVASYHRYITAMSLQSLQSWFLLTVMPFMSHSVLQSYQS